ncbi:MAG: redox-regulated ATPase YchF [Anaerolineales bacterium]|jgi:GTP-binding protein YchF
MRLGIIGLPACGKTTIFNALTGEQLPTGELIDRVEIHTAVADVPDDRLMALSRLYQPKKTTHTKVTYTDIGGLKADAGREGLPGQLVNQLEQVDGYLHVVRAFQDPNIPHPLDAIDPARDINMMQEELLLHDLVVVEKRLERLAEARQKGGRDRAQIERDQELFEKFNQSLNQGQPLRMLELSIEERKALGGFGLLSIKPVLVLVNLGEGQDLPAMDVDDDIAVLGLQGELEMEIAQLPDDEMSEFLNEYGLEEPGRQRVLRSSYDVLNLQSFFTVGEDEVRAWKLAKGATALEAAGTVHSDMARGFIRAEVIFWERLIALGGLSEARAQGELRLEGKDYRVQDGEVVHIRFNI